jgi:sigma-B regulation protein RsbU (phosphoserine phosphatase)
MLRNPVVQVDFSSPATVIDRLNRTFQMKDHGGKFFSAWYGVYSRSKQTVTYANAGHPPTVLLTRHNGTTKLSRTEPGASVLGIMPTIDVPEITIPFPTTSELYLFTDGLYELLDPKGGRGSYTEFFTYIEKEVGTGRLAWKAMLAWFENAREGRLIDDDVSLLRFATRA